LIFFRCKVKIPPEVAYETPANHSLLHLPNCLSLDFCRVRAELPGNERPRSRPAATRGCFGSATDALRLRSASPHSAHMAGWIPSDLSRTRQYALPAFSRPLLRFPDSYTKLGSGDIAPKIKGSDGPRIQQNNSKANMVLFCALINRYLSIAPSPTWLFLEFTILKRCDRYFLTLLPCADNLTKAELAHTVVIDTCVS
jgi:hypothetical protein